MEGDGPRDWHGSMTIAPAKLAIGVGVSGDDVEACAIALEIPLVVSRSFCLGPLGGPNLMLAGALDLSATFATTVFDTDCVVGLTEQEAEGILEHGSEIFTYSSRSRPSSKA